MTIYDLTVKNRKKEDFDLSTLKGKVSLVVNTATGCGFTPQYDEIHEFCTAKYKTTFDQFDKIDVNGENECPVFTILKKAIPAEEVKGLKNKMAMKAIRKISTTCVNEGDISWNFTKFLVDKEGHPVKRYDPTFNPSDIEKDLIELL